MLTNNKNCQTFLQLTIFPITYLQLTISISLANGIFSINGLNGTQRIQLLRYPYNLMRPDETIFCWPKNSFWLTVSISTVPFHNGFDEHPTMAQLSVILVFAPISVPLHHNMIRSPYTYAIWQWVSTAEILTAFKNCMTESTLHAAGVYTLSQTTTKRIYLRFSLTLMSI